MSKRTYKEAYGWLALGGVLVVALVLGGLGALFNYYQTHQKPGFWETQTNRTPTQSSVETYTRDQLEAKAKPELIEVVMVQQAWIEHAQDVITYFDVNKDLSNFERVVQDIMDFVDENSDQVMDIDEVDQGREYVRKKFYLARKLLLRGASHPRYDDGVAEFNRAVEHMSGMRFQVRNREGETVSFDVSEYRIDQ